MIPNNWFYKLMYRKRIIKLTAESGNNYIVEYHRSPFWTYDKLNLKTFFKDKFKTWHGQVWMVYKNGSRCGFGTICIKTLCPYFEMKKFLNVEVWRLERILNKENNNDEK